MWSNVEYRVFITGQNTVGDLQTGRCLGVASVEHATMIDDEGIALAKQHGLISIWISPPTSAYRNKEKPGRSVAHGSYPKSQEFTLEDLQAAVDEASHLAVPT